MSRWRPKNTVKHLPEHRLLGTPKTRHITHGFRLEVKQTKIDLTLVSGVRNENIRIDLYKQ